MVVEEVCLWNCWDIDWGFSGCRWDIVGCIGFGNKLKCFELVVVIVGGVG